MIDATAIANDVARVPVRRIVVGVYTILFYSLQHAWFVVPDKWRLVPSPPVNYAAGSFNISSFVPNPDWPATGTRQKYLAY